MSKTLVSINGKWEVKQENLSHRQELAVTYCIMNGCAWKIILTDGYQGLMNAHMGVEKTTACIVRDFYWPGVVADVRRYVPSCDLCQGTAARQKTQAIPN